MAFLPRETECPEMWSEGKKFDTGKLRYDLVPSDALEEIVEVLTYGAAKYAPRNWEKGIAWGRIFAAILRHLWAFWRGQERDPESGLSHLAHAGCGVMMLLSHSRRSELKGFDDRVAR